MNDPREQVLRQIIAAAPLYSNIYLRGSFLLGTQDDMSDIDFLVVCPKNTRMNQTFKLEDLAKDLRRNGVSDIDIVGHDQFQNLLHFHDPMAVEVHLCTASHLIRAFEPSFVLNKAQLRGAFSQVASNSWVKAKKKLTVKEDYDERAARKSLFHSFRLLDLGIQIASGTSIDIRKMAPLYAEINALPPDYELWHSTFRERHNQLHTEFRKVCPKI